MSVRFLKDISASGIQVILGQVMGLAVFYLTSTYLSKDLYGELNWTLATVSFLVLIAASGMEQVVLKKIASGEHSIIHRVFIWHSLISSFIFFLLLILARFLFPDFFTRHFMIPALAIAQVLFFLSSPFKQLLNGKEKFRALAFITAVSGICKISGLLILVFSAEFSISLVLAVFIAASLVELLVSFFVVKKMGFDLRPVWKFREYRKLVKESFPQLGVNVFDSALARTDWILLGFLAGTVATAEYAFAYKIFEISRLPMLILAPVILPRFARYFSEQHFSPGRPAIWQHLFRNMIAISFLLPLFFNLSWTPLFSWITRGKYGAVNETVYLVLSFAVPFHYAINFLWTMEFARGKIRLTFWITVAVAIINIIFNLIWIPVAGATGAAIAFASGTLIQLLLYWKFTSHELLKTTLNTVFLCFAAAALVLWISRFFEFHFITAVCFALPLYIILILQMGVLRFNDLRFKLKSA